jgi:cytochrome c
MMMTRSVGIDGLRRWRVALVLASCLTPWAYAEDKALGELLFEACTACHSRKPEDHNVGPSLAGIWGRKAGTTAGFRFSNALKRSERTWDNEGLNAFLADPQQDIPGNRMPFSGIASASDRVALIEFLRSLPPHQTELRK